MRYYIPVDLEEHLLYAHEIASRFDLTTESGALHSQFVRAVILLTNQPLQSVYYETKHGLRPVYSNTAVAKAMLWTYNQLKNNAPGLYHINVGMRTYHVHIGLEFFKTVHYILNEIREESK